MSEPVAATPRMGTSPPPGRSVADLRPWTNPAERSFIEIQGVTKRFGAVIAVNQVSLSIYRGEIFGLLGGSGSGKTTLLRVLAGFETPDEGSVVIDGQCLDDRPPYRRPVNMMFQSYALFPHMSVERNVGYGLRMAGQPARVIRERVAEALRLVQLEGYERRRPHQLSGGQKQRVALARALINQPKVLLLDEPLAALDKKLREETRFELVKIQESLGITFIVVTHDQEEAMTLSTRIGVMRDGRIIQIGPPRDVYERPNSRFVADFLGSVNLFPGLVSIGGGRFGVRSEAAGILIRIDPAHDLSPDQKVWVAVRPEKIRLTREPPQDDRNVVEGTVDEVAYMGSQSIYRVNLDTGFRIHAVLANVERTGERDISWDEPVYASWHRSAGMVLTE